LEAFPQDLPFFLPFGSGMGKILHCNPFPYSIKKKKEKKKMDLISQVI
jgi:hypothetical protein